MTCLRCGRYAPPDRETGYAGDDLCPECRAVAEAIADAMEEALRAAEACEICGEHKESAQHRIVKVFLSNRGPEIQSLVICDDCWLRARGPRPCSECQAPDEIKSADPDQDAYHEGQ
jgi:hypothetical protein